MPIFSETAAAVLNGGTVTAAPLVRLDFASGIFRAWQGFGDIEAGGETWRGAGELGTITGLEAAIGATAPQVVFGMSGLTPELVNAMLNASDEARDRAVRVYLQVFNQETWAPLDSPVLIFFGTMDQLRGELRGVSQSKIEVTAETVWVRRGTAPWAWLSDRDQKRLWGESDQFCNQMASMAMKAGGGWPLS